jgi:hypothetical protein
MFYSDPNRRTNHSLHRNIVDLGRPIVPFLLEDMFENDFDWSLTLVEITGAKPYPDEVSNEFDTVKKAWRAWADEKSTAYSLEEI